ncbi:MAG: hypothetical protein RIT02_2035 [Planctomycetota bacterium]
MGVVCGVWWYCGGFGEWRWRAEGVDRVVFDVCQSENVLKWKWVSGGSTVQCKRGDLRVVGCSVFGAERLDFFQLVSRSGSGVHRHISTIERDDGSCDPC